MTNSTQDLIEDVKASIRKVTKDFIGKNIDVKGMVKRTIGYLTTTYCEENISITSSKEELGQGIVKAKISFYPITYEVTFNYEEKIIPCEG